MTNSHINSITHQIIHLDNIGSSNKRIRQGLSIAAIILTAVFTLGGCTTLSTALISTDTNVVTAFNMENNEVIGTLMLPQNPGTYYSYIPVLWSGGSIGYLSQGSKVHIIKINETGIVLSDTVDYGGQVVATSKDNPWLLIRKYLSPTGVKLAAANPLNGNEISSVTFSSSSDISDVDICNDGQTVLVRSFLKKELKLLSLDKQGQLSDTGHMLSFNDFPEDMACAPGAKAGAVLMQDAPSFISFTIDATTGLNQKDTGLSKGDTLPNPGLHINNGLAFSADGTGLFIRSSRNLGGNQDGWIQRFSFDPLTAQIGDAPIFTEMAGVEYNKTRNIGVNPNGSVIYLPNNFIASGRIRIRDAATGNYVEDIILSDMPNPFQFTVVSD